LNKTMTLVRRLPHPQTVGTVPPSITNAVPVMLEAAVGR
jgi:hypothetical protein